MRLLIVAGSVLLCLFTFGAADAAVVILTNGDRITGKIIKMQDKKLEIDPDQSSDNLTIDWEDVKSITSDEPMAVKLHRNVEVPATIGGRVGDRNNLYNLEEGGPIVSRMVEALIYRSTITLAPSQPVAIRRPATRKLRP